MANLEWEKNLWIKEKKPFEIDAPYLNLEKLDVLFKSADDTDIAFMEERGILLGHNAFLYYETPYLYFRDPMGTYAIRKDMRPDDDNMISYFQWRDNHWVRHKDVESELV
jgi:hypothetical protein